MMVYKIKNLQLLILTSIEFVQENSPDIQTLIKLYDLIYERKVSLSETYKTAIKIVKVKLKQKILVDGLLM